MQAAEPPAQLLPHLGIERAERLVEEQDLRVDRECPRKGDALLLAAGELPRQAVGEACALVLPEALPGGDLEADFRQTAGTLTVSVRVPTVGRAEPDYESFAWQVLSTLSTEASAAADDSHLEVTFSSDSSLASLDGRPGAGD